ncbi:MAG: SDR family NAD(P)-dependent oxidoreductase, partial [Anaerolineales bacterium]|nr:SDR family NAD(P)-dependent oxidoreductase [Anaerolineales bacterium]
MPDLFDLTGQTAVVTGGSKGLGLEMAYALAEAGANVVLGARTEVAVKAAAAELQEAIGRSARGLVLDVTQPDSCAAF